ncbi:MAG TPA: hypothetical protein VK638_59080 [Edaphobacter sp.]|nr:hypothetical protein [Edaphobacter sp.]
MSEQKPAEKPWWDHWRPESDYPEGAAEIPPTTAPCEYCGPKCYRGAEHNARVEDNAKYTDDAAQPVEGSRELPVPCPDCGGSGQVSDSATCYECKGDGYLNLAGIAARAYAVLEESHTNVCRRLQEMSRPAANVEGSREMCECACHDQGEPWCEACYESDHLADHMPEDVPAAQPVEGPREPTCKCGHSAFMHWQQMFDCQSEECECERFAAPVEGPRCPHGWTGLACSHLISDGNGAAHCPDCGYIVPAAAPIEGPVSAPIPMTLEIEHQAHLTTIARCEVLEERIGRAEAALRWISIEAEGHGGVCTSIKNHADATLSPSHETGGSQ